MKHKFKKTIALLLAICMAQCALPIIAVADEIEHPVKLTETGVLFSTLNEAIAEAKSDGYSTFTLEVIGDVTETSEVIIGSENVTIVGSGGAHTINMTTAPGAPKRLTVDGGGILTLGDGTDDDPLTFLLSVRVKDGTVSVQDGVVLRSSTALELSGPNVNGTISGGRLEGSTIALSMNAGARLYEISGGVFAGKQDAVHLSGEGTKIEKISGGAFYQTDPDATLHGHAVFVQNYSQIDEITGGYFDAVRNSALILVRGGKVGEISGGEFVAHRVGSFANNDRNAAIWVENGWESEGFIGTGIDTISGGHLSGAYFGLLLIADYGYCYVNNITGGTFEGTVAMQNDRGSTITDISGGTFTGAQGIFNVNKIGKIGGLAEIHGTSSYGIFNYSGARIDEISGGSIVSDRDHGIANAGTIKLISGGVVIGYRSAINCDGMNKGRLEVISNGVFWGKNNTAIMLAYVLELEPGLEAIIGFGRYWGKDGVIFNNEDLVNYPAGYWMSTETKPVAGITDVEFKYLTNGQEPEPEKITEGGGSSGGASGGGSGSGSGGKKPDVELPIIEIPDKETPWTPFITDHIAYIIGFPDSTAGPDRNTTRAEAATIFFRLLSDEMRAQHWTKHNPFSDVQNGMWHNNAISVLYRIGIVQGYPDGTFRPGEPITRAELSVMAARFAREMHMHWVNGYPDGTFRPNRYIKRAEVMTLVNRMLERAPEIAEDLLKDEMITWMDNTDPKMWYYLAVQEATNSHLPEYKDKPAPGLPFNFEYWVEMMPNRDWAELERR